MEEIKIQIEVIEQEMLALENRVDYFSVNGRSPSKKDRFDQIKILNEWRDYNIRLLALKEVLDAIENNARYNDCNECTAYPFDKRGETPICKTCNLNPTNK